MFQQLERLQFKVSRSYPVHNRIAARENLGKFACLVIDNESILQQHFRQELFAGTESRAIQVNLMVIFCIQASLDLSPKFPSFLQ